MFNALGTQSGLVSLLAYAQMIQAQPPTSQELKVDNIWEINRYSPAARDLILYHRAISEVVESTLRRYCPHTDSMLEIGCGDSPIVEYMPNFPQACKDEIHFSDVNPAAVKRNRIDYSGNKVFMYNVTDLSGIQEGSYRGVVMHDVFNAFFEDLIEKSCRQIYKVLQTNGHFIHFSTRELVRIQALDEFKQKHQVYFPIIGDNNQWEGITIINRSQFIRFLDSHKLEDLAEQAFFFTYASLSQPGRYLLCMEAVHPHRAPAFKTLSERIIGWNLPSAQTVLFDNHFYKKIEQSLTAAGFHIRKFDLEWGYHTGSRDDAVHMQHPEKNLFIKDRMNFREEKIHVLPPHLIQEMARVHVVVAQKP